MCLESLRKWDLDSLQQYGAASVVELQRGAWGCEAGQGLRGPQEGDSELFGWCVFIFETQLS